MTRAARRAPELFGLFLLLKFVLVAGGCASSAPQPREEAGLDARIGQMLMVGFRGLAVEGKDFILRDIRRRNLGGVILFDYDVVTGEAVRNIESPAQLKKLVGALQGASTTPLLIAVDQEGGRVTRLKERDGFPPTPSHGELGRKDDQEHTAREAGRIAATLSGVGINLNLAPVVDLCVNPDNPVIAALDRCFSAEPEKTARHALAFSRAHHRRGVLTALKHFPGHGSSRGDSHLGFTDVTGTWSRDELYPYGRIIDAGQADAVMTAHVFNARLDENYPATLSEKVVTGILREKLGFDGVIISDDLQMKAIADHYGFETAIRRAIEAGVDILLFGNNLEYDEKIVTRVVAVIRDLVRRGVVDEERIDESYRRIQNLKKRLGKEVPASPGAAVTGNGDHQGEEGGRSDGIPGRMSTGSEGTVDGSGMAGRDRLRHPGPDLLD